MKNNVALFGILFVFNCADLGACSRLVTQPFKKALQGRCHCKVALSEWRLAVHNYKDTQQLIRYEEDELKETFMPDIRASLEKQLKRSRELLKTRQLVLLQRAGILNNRTTYYQECARFVEEQSLEI